MADIKLDGDAAVVGGIHSDSHNIENHYTTNTQTTNNNTVNQNNVYQAAKSYAELHAEQVKQFLHATINACKDGTISPIQQQELNLLRMELTLSVQEANEIIMQVKNGELMKQQALKQQALKSQVMAQVPPMPKMPKAMDAQQVQLSQMQGFNPLMAANQMGIGSAGFAQQMSQMPQMPQSTQMPQMSPMPQSTQMQAPPMPQQTQVPPMQPPAMPLAQASQSYPVPVDPQYGIILTDSIRLATKYHSTPQEVYDVLSGFIQQSQELDMNWYLLDTAQYQQQLGNEPFWLDINNIISDFMQQGDFTYGIHTPIFIIGGHDVIPIPMVEDTFGTSDTGQMPSDMCYCFSGHFFSDLWDQGDHTITEASVRNTIARLPLEDGEMETSLQEDLQSYFNLCTLYYKDGIPVNNVMMTANASWLPASKTMSEHLPLLQNSTDPQMVQDGMYVSPPVSPEDEQSIAPVCQSMQSVGMLLFNLHGAGSNGMSGFYSDEGEAFSIEMLDNSNARVFNTVACYGARYHGFQRDDSMLLSSFYGKGILLYAGSLIPVPMIPLNVPDGVEVHEGSGSEHLMPIFCMEQYTGIPVGEAMMKAKLEYFNTFRHMERDDFSLATMMMFSLYGNPMLRMQRNDEVLRRAEQEHVLPVLPSQKSSIPVRMKRTQRIMFKEQLQSKSLIEQLRACVDQNISAIHQIVQQNVYNALGIEPRWLTHVDAFSIPNGDGTYDEGYVYAYDDESKAFGNKLWAEVDFSGKIKKVITIK